MPARTAETVYREILHATGKVGTKSHRWPVGIFTNAERLQAHAALLKMAYEAGNAALVKTLDPHSPATEETGLATEVKFSKASIQYNPTAPGLDSDPALV